MSAGTIQHLKYRTLSKHIDIVCIHMLGVNIFIASVEAAYITLQSFQFIPVDFGFCFCQFLIQEQTIVPLHQNNMLRWSAAAAVVIMAMGAGVLFMNKEESSVEPAIPVAVAENPAPQTIETQPEPQAETCVQMAQVSHSNNTEKRIRKSNRPVVAKKTIEEQIPSETQELQKDICIDSELQNMEDEMMAMVNEFENM